MTQKSKHYILLGLFLISSLCFAQKPEIYFEQLTIDEGLSSNNVQCITEDIYGYIWFGTKDGLNKFDGYSCEVFRNIPEDSRSICNNDILALACDKETGNIWVATANDLSYFDRATYQFINFTNSESGKILKNTNLLSLLIDNEGYLWVGTHDGLFKIDKKKNTVEIYKYAKTDENSIIDNTIFSLFLDSKERIWIGTSKGTDIFDKKTNTFLHSPNLNQVINTIVTYEDINKNIWLGTRTEGLFFIEKGEPDNKIKKYNKENGYLGNNKIFGILEDENNNLIILNRDVGFVLFNIKEHKFTTYKPDIYYPNGINSKALTTGIKNSTGIIFIGTFSSGINYIDTKRKKFNHYKVNFKEDGLSNNNVRSLYQDSDSKIWIGTKENGGLSSFDKELGTFKNYKVIVNNPEHTVADFIFTICELDANNLLLGTLQSGIIKFNKKTKTFQEFNIEKTNVNRSGKSQTYIYDIKKGYNEVFWIGKFECLLRYDAVRNVSKKIHEINQIRTILVDNDSIIWVGTENKGLFLYNDNTSEITNLSEPNNQFAQIEGKRIISLLKDSTILWIGTEGNGLNKLDLQNKTVEVYNEIDGLTNNRIAGVLKDEHGNLWISTGHGLSKFNIESKSFENYTKQDGLQGNEFSNFASLKLNTGEMLFGGNNGFNIFLPHEIKKNERPPNVYITGFKLFNKPIPIGSPNSPLRKHISHSDELTLTHKQSVFSIDFVALNYTSPEKNQYKYKLEKFDSEWIEAGTNRTATYTDLPAGKYIFKVKASNNDGVWNNNPATLNLKILAPWWKTLWFKIVTILVAIGGIFIHYLLRMNQMRSINSLLEKKVSERTHDLKEANLKLQENQKKIEEQNTHLISSEEELNSKHAMLLEQKEELEATLNKLKETQSQLLHSEKMASIGILTAGITHELNNPLNFIQSGLYAIENYLQFDTEEQKKEIEPLLKNIEVGIKRATTIIKNLNKFSHSGRNNTQYCDIQEIIDSCLVIISNEIKNRIEIVKNYMSNGPKVIGNEGKLNQVFLNILINACQAIENKGEIKITTSIHNNCINVTIEDTGVGISKENLNKIMVPFFTTKPPGKGTGLGMSISYTLIQEHKGSINYQSELGKGTIVTVELPIS